MVTLVFTGKQGVIVNKSLKLGDIEFAALMVLKDKRKNGPLFFKYSRASRIRVNDYWKEICQTPSARLKDIKTLNSNGFIYRHLKSPFKQQLDNTTILLKIRSLICLISNMNDHSNDNCVLQHYIDARWIFAFLKKKTLIQLYLLQVNNARNSLGLYYS